MEHWYGDCECFCLILYEGQNYSNGPSSGQKNWKNSSRGRIFKKSIPKWLPWKKESGSMKKAKKNFKIQTGTGAGRDLKKWIYFWKTSVFCNKLFFYPWKHYLKITRTKIIQYFVNIYYWFSCFVNVRKLAQDHHSTIELGKLLSKVTGTEYYMIAISRFSKT